MNEKKCLGCYRVLDQDTNAGYHFACAKKLFGVNVPPTLNISLSELETLALTYLNQRLGVTGVQPKLSLDHKIDSQNPTNRLMIIDVFGGYILKPPTERFPNAPVVEDLTMHMAKTVGIETARHGLIRLKSGEFAYVTKRFDRAKKKKKIAVEDFCQLSELLTESKYKTSTEKAGKIILKYSDHPGLDIVRFFDLVLFCYLTGNADMHLKNFSLMRNQYDQIILTPAYDLLATELMPINDPEEVALTINSKKSKLKRPDFLQLGQTLKISNQVMDHSFKRVLRGVPKMKELIHLSFLSNELKTQYEDLLDLRTRVLHEEG